jgi:hypothetical protein
MLIDANVPPYPGSIWPVDLQMKDPPFYPGSPGLFSNGTGSMERQLLHLGKQGYVDQGANASGAARPNWDVCQ